MRRATKFVLSAALAVGLTGTAAAQTLLVLAEDVPAGLNVDGASIAIPTTQTGVDNLMEPLIYFKSAGKNADGVGTFNFNEFEGRLAESWSFDEATVTWTMNLRRGVKGCNGATFNADDVIYSFERGKSVSGSAPIVWFLANVASFDKFTPDVFGDSPEAIDRLLERDQFKAALEACRRVGTRPGNRDLSRLLFQYGRAYRGAGQPRDALVMFVRCAVLYPDSVDAPAALMETALIYRDVIGQPDTARRLLEHARAVASMLGQESQVRRASRELDAIQ